MKNFELQQLLKQYPDDMDVKLYHHPNLFTDFDNENICDHADDDKLHFNSQNVVKGVGKRYLVINPPIS